MTTTKQHHFQENDIVIRNDKTDDTIYRITKVCQPLTNIVTLRDFVLKNNINHKVSKKYYDKENKIVRYPRWDQYFDLDSERVLSRIEAFGGICLIPIVTLNFTKKVKIRRVQIVNRSWELKKGVQSAHKALSAVNVLDILLFQERVAKAVQSFANCIPGDVMEKISS